MTINEFIIHAAGENLWCFHFIDSRKYEPMITFDVKHGVPEGREDVKKFLAEHGNDLVCFFNFNYVCLAPEPVVDMDITYRGL